MRNILTAIETHSAIESVLQTALLLGRRFDGYIEGMTLGPDLTSFADYDMPVGWTIPDLDTFKDTADDCRRRFETFMIDSAVLRYEEGSRALSFGFASEEWVSDNRMAGHARVFDITVLGRPGTERGSPRRATAEAALFESGRPVLLAPPEPPQSLGETIVIAWNQSMESARATGFAMPLLMKAKRVVVLTIEAHNVPGPPADRLAKMLATNGVPVEVVHRLGKKRPAGLAYLEDAASLGGDLMVKGAYTQSRLRQMIFGGATAHILAKAQMPVLMAN